MKYLKKIFESSNFNSMTDEELEEKLHWLRTEWAEINREISQIVGIQKARKESSEEELTKDWPESIWDLDKFQLSWVLEHGNHTTSKHYDISHKYLRRLEGVLDSGFNGQTNQYEFWITMSAWEDDSSSDYVENEKAIKSIELLVNNLKPLSINGEEVIKFKVLFNSGREGYDTNVYYHNKDKVTITEGRHLKKEYKSIEEAIKYLVSIDSEDHED